ncbi:uncharacterized protein C8A04DRAFT_13379 [Dichotomopilus funicola]|uniref:F-box domain-containing protein n=1 Tax=Dichotomopilus funicola TaxID=1934379 RepID=A0AAN6ZK54_9PEZI|nr:hypothetical protein C8A04DRAFT_13379 [Dichotomopilus funicola]
MSANQVGVGTLEEARRRLAIAQAARRNATREEIESQGIQPFVDMTIENMNTTQPMFSHSFKRSKLFDSNTHKVYDYGADKMEEEYEDEDEDEDEDDAAEEEFEMYWRSMIKEVGKDVRVDNLNVVLLAEFRQIARQRQRMITKAALAWREGVPPPVRQDRFDLFGSLCNCTDLIIEVCKHMRPKDIVTLYSISKRFHAIVDQNMRNFVFAMAGHMAPTGARIFSSPVYKDSFIRDPSQRTVTHADQALSEPQWGQARYRGQDELNEIRGRVRLIPGLLWLQMVVNREIRVRDILACLARMGHRMPKGSHVTLKKIWLIMDASASRVRVMFLNNPDFFTDEDLYIAQMFMVKLVLAFNHPTFGPQSSMLMRLMLGQRGLSPLWALLRNKKYRSAAEIRQLKLRYDVGAAQIQDENLVAMTGHELDRLGTLHLEGWGVGKDHLMRLDELIPLECARRQLGYDQCVEEMMIYGHVDFDTGNSLVPSLDEMYMSDDELPEVTKTWKPLRHELIHSGCGNVPFNPSNWQPKHARKARWDTLTEEEKAMILEAEQEEMEGLNELDLARWHQSVAWARLAKLTSQELATKKIKTKYMVKAPSNADLDSHLHQFNHVRPLRLASRHEELAETHGPDAMDIDGPAPAQDHDSDNLSDIPDEDLILDAIPETEVNRIFRSFGPRRPYREDSDLGSNDEGDGPNNQTHNQQHGAHDNNPQAQATQQPLSQTQYHNLHHPHLQITGPALEDQPTTGNNNNAEEAESELETEYDDATDSSGPDSDDEDDIFGNYPVRVSSAVNLFPVSIYDVAPEMRTTYYTPATATAMDVDDMLLALAEMPYSEDGIEEGTAGDGGGNDDDEDGDDENSEDEEDSYDDDPEGEYDGYATYEEWSQHNTVYDLPVVLGSPDEGEIVIDNTNAEDEAEADADADADMHMNGPDDEDDDDDVDDDDDGANVNAAPGIQLPVQGFEDVAGINLLMSELAVVPGSSQDQDQGQDQEDSESMDPGESAEEQKIMKLRDWYRPW